MQQMKQDQIIDEYPENLGYDSGEDRPGNNPYQDDEEGEIETLYVYTYDPEEPLFRFPVWNKDQIIAAIMGVLALAMLVGLCFLPDGQTYTITTMSVPAHLHTLELKASADIIPTGKKEDPATRATGTLKMYNGSFLSQQLPAHFILTASNGVEVATDQTVMIPAENTATNPPSNGEASVSAHAMMAGSEGNIQAGAINAVYGPSLYIKNLAAFAGGQDAYTKQYVTSGDTTTALTAARYLLTAKQPLGLLAKPCTEQVSQHSLSLFVTWACEYVTYQIPKDGQILSERVSGNSVIVKMRIVVRPMVTHFAK